MTKDEFISTVKCVRAALERIERAGATWKRKSADPSCGPAQINEAALGYERTQEEFYRQWRNVKALLPYTIYEEEK